VTSETFVRAWARRDRLRTETLKAYLLAIARNVYLRNTKRNTNHQAIDEEMPDGAPDPQRQTSARMELDHVTDAITKLPETDRLALVLRTEHALAYAEIARVLEISEGAARVRIHRARRRLLAEAMTRNGGHK
jgi:RNA polymerase sigma-70 factor (ECF subfamily)